MPAVSFIILTWNSAAHLPRCLACLTAQTYNDFEIIIVDNASTDSAVDKLDETYPKLALCVKRLDSNLGFAAANNIGARLARGEWLVLLNADAFLEPDWLANMLTATQRHPNAFFSSCLLQANNPDTVDGQGDVYHVSGLAWRRNYNLPRESDLLEDEVFSACAAAALYPTQTFLALGGFDEDYFAYHEDVDLGFRLRLNGLKCFYVPSAVAHHIGSTSFGKRGERATYLGHRNLVWTFLKDMPGPLLWLFLPIHLVYTLIHLVYFTSIGQGRAIWKAKLDGWAGMIQILRKRKMVQQNRKVPIREILSVMEQKLFAPIINIRKRSQPK